MSLSFLAPQFLWALLAIPLVILLHFIRARKKRQEVSALFLWAKARALAQQRRRFSPTWLLILQLAFVALAALALAQPSLSFRSEKDRVFIIDASASMAAREEAGSRLEQATLQAEELFSGAGRVAIIRAGLDATVLQPLSSNRGEWRQALNTLVAADVRADLKRALALARAVAPGAELHLFSDSPPPTGFEAEYHPLGTEAPNLGISAFELRGQQAFVSVVTNSPRPQQVDLEISRNGQAVARTNLLVPANGQANASFPIDGTAGFYRADLTVPAWDALALDDVAFTGSRDMQLLLSPPSVPLERALNAIPGLSLRLARSLPANTASYDALVLIGELTEMPQPGRYLWFAPETEVTDVQTISDWDRSDPLLRFVDLTGVKVGIDPDLPPLPTGDWQVLAQTDELKPAILRLRTSELDIIAARFNPLETDMTSRTALPIWLTNVMAVFRGEERLELGSPLPTTETILLNGTVLESSRVLSPGVYRLGEQTYSASLLNAEESRLAPPPPAINNETVESEGSERQQGLAFWLMLLALLALISEWLLWSSGRRGRGSRGFGQ